MRIIKTEIKFTLCLTIFLTACNGITSTPAASQTDTMGTAVSMVKTEVVMTQAALPTATLISPTDIPPGDYSNNYAPPPGKLDYAKITLRKHHALLPYVNDVEEIFGLEYYGCVETDDFGGSIAYNMALPIETVDRAFIEFFNTDHWEFIEPDRGFEMGIPTIKYEVYRISTEDDPAFERLEVILYDYSPLSENGTSQTNMRSNLIHVEDRRYFTYVFDFADYPCKKWFAFNTGW